MAKKKRKAARTGAKKSAKKSPKKAAKKASKKASKRKTAPRKARKSAKRMAGKKVATKKSAPARTRKSAKPAARRAGKKIVAKKAAPARKAPAKSEPLEPFVVKPAGRPSTGAARGPRYSTGAPKPVGPMYGEGNWKADEEYREGLSKFSATHDSEAIARNAARDLEKGGKKEGSEEESEW